MPTRSGGLHTTLRRSVIGVFLLAALLTVALAVGLQYYFGQLIAEAIDDKFSHTGSHCEREHELPLMLA